MILAEFNQIFDVSLIKLLLKIVALEKQTLTVEYELTCKLA